MATVSFVAEGSLSHLPNDASQLPPAAINLLKAGSSGSQESSIVVIFHFNIPLTCFPRASAIVDL